MGRTVVALAAIWGCNFGTRDAGQGSSGGEERGMGGSLVDGGANPSLRAETPSIGEGVERVEEACDPSARETYNGLDDNCNGQIDEGLVRSGAIQITLWWETDADVDLRVIDPAGDEIGYDRRESDSGGRLDVDGRGACTAPRSTTENVYWNTDRPPSGLYQVVIDYFDACGSTGPTPVVLSISVGGETIASYRYSLGQGDRRLTMATFRIP